jgi:hypothetical protein
MQGRLCNTVCWELPCPQLLKVFIHLAEHPDRERELEVRVRDRAAFVEHTLDGFLRPRAVLNKSNPSQRG